MFFLVFNERYSRKTPLLRSIFLVVQKCDDLSNIIHTVLEFLITGITNEVLSAMLASYCAR